MRKKLLAVIVLVLGGVFLLGALILVSLGGRSSVSANPFTGLSGVSAGVNHTCALSDGGANVKCWGQLDYGYSSPLPVDRDTGGAVGVQLSMGVNSGCGLTSGGGVKCTGINNYGQLGDGTFIDSASTPVDVVGLGSGVAAIDVGSYHVCALTTSGGVKCWGANFYGQLGDGTTANSSSVPVDVSGLASDVESISSGDSHTCAVLTSGALKCWGNNFDGQLGNGTTVGSNVPIDVDGLASGVAEVSAGGAGSTHSHTCARMDSGGVKCWGDNGAGQLGDGTETMRTTPVDVLALDEDVASVSAGGLHTCARTTTGGLRCWGINSSGQLGDGSTAPSTLPVTPMGLSSGVAALSSGRSHTCVELDTGLVACAGNNSFGQLGDGTFDNKSTFVTVVSVVKPTPTPTLTTTPTPSTPGLDFALGIDPFGGENDACASTYGPFQTCQVRLGKPFTVRVYLHALPAALPGGQYSGYLATLPYSGVGPTGQVDTSGWPDCFSPVTDLTSSQVSIGCDGPSSAYTGVLGSVDLTCSRTGSVVLEHGFVQTALIKEGLDRYYEGVGIGETVNVECVPPQALPGDQDGDGCADLVEDGPDESQGGRRDYLNPYDFYDIDGNKVIDLFIDIFGVAGAFGLTPGDAGYDAALDRSAAPPGAEAWVMGPPDGTIDLFIDIFGVAFQFGHDCS